MSSSSDRQFPLFDYLSRSTTAKLMSNLELGEAMMWNNHFLCQQCYKTKHNKKKEKKSPAPKSKQLLNDLQSDGEWK